MKKKIKKVLVANRGEIALRVIRACRELSIKTVAVYSDVDRFGVHTLSADEVVEIGPAPPAESYLNIDKIISVAKNTGCDAIHPGYGFLAENALFAKSCQDSGLIFIGPKPEAMILVGDKLKARSTMKKAGVPLIPGIDGHLSAIKNLENEASRISFPLMVKASAGGGGKGMRIVSSLDELHSALEAAKREAKSSFGADTVYIEKFVSRPRHVEFQILADNYGNMVHLFERECSIQRRHQKIIEETPSAALTNELRQKMGQIACDVMQAVGYTNAGTVEFLLDDNKSFYFLEVNARIQVEHPVTEMVTGIDLVKQQIRVAEGEKLQIEQKNLRQKGHAIECRVYAEDPQNSFYPSIGKLNFVKEPQGPGIRCDSGIYTGLEIVHYYDPILSKLIAWHEDRTSAIDRMVVALSDYVIMGVKTPISFLKDLIRHPKFVEGDYDTGFIEKYFSNWEPKISQNHIDIALLTTAWAQMVKKRSSSVSKPSKEVTPWQSIGDWEVFSE
jgi:acetyl-CoA carboxylase biotin carboxylase subunit